MLRHGEVVEASTERAGMPLEFHGDVQDGRLTMECPEPSWLHSWRCQLRADVHRRLIATENEDDIVSTFVVDRRDHRNDCLCQQNSPQMEPNENKECDLTERRPHTLFG